MSGFGVFHFLSDEPSEYGWIITRDLVTENYLSTDSEDGSNDVGTIGPRNISDEMMERLKNGEGTKFRMYDDDDNLYYEGRYLGDLNEGDPVQDFGGPNAGAVYMTEIVNGKWQITIG